MKKLFAGICLLLLLTGTVFAADPIKIGYIATLTGEGSTWGQHERDGALMAVKEINAAGGLLGRPVELFYYDIKGKPEDAVNAVRRLVYEDKVVFIGGSNYSSIQLSISPIVNKEQIPVMGTATTNPAVTVNADTGEVIPYMFRMAYTDPYQGKVMADYLIKKLGKKKIAIIGDVGDPYSEGLSEFVKIRSDEFGIEHRFFGFRAGDVDFRAQITDAKDWGADALAMTMFYKEMGLVMKQALELGWKPAFIGGDGYSPSLFEVAGPAAEGSFWVYSMNENDDGFKNIYAKYVKEYGKDPTEPSNVVYAYDVISVFADAIKRAGKAEGPAIKEAMEKTKDLQLAHFKYTVDVATHNPLNKPAAMMVAVKDGSGGYKLDFLEMWEPQDNF
ncbi:MAG: ABC transporter substrate-binding protein [Synergistaceae bacterium]|nr:ABC transporter substrate-binding protein [Synergistaceae bacterium]